MLRAAAIDALAERVRHSEPVAMAALAIVPARACPAAVALGRDASAREPLDAHARATMGARALASLEALATNRVTRR